MEKEKAACRARVSGHKKETDDHAFASRIHTHNRQRQTGEQIQYSTGPGSAREMPADETEKSLQAQMSA